MSGIKVRHCRVFTTENGTDVEILSSHLERNERALIDAFALALHAAASKVRSDFEIDFTLSPVNSKPPQAARGVLQSGRHSASVELHPREDQLKITVSSQSDAYSGSKPNTVERIYKRHGSRWLNDDAVATVDGMLKSAPKMPLHEAIAEFYENATKPALENRVCIITTSQKGTNVVINTPAKEHGQRHITEITSNPHTQVEIEGFIVEPNDRMIVSAAMDYEHHVNLRAPALRQDERQFIEAFAGFMHTAASKRQFDLNLYLPLPPADAQGYQNIKGELTAGARKAELAVDFRHREIKIWVPDLAQDRIEVYSFNNYDARSWKDVIGKFAIEKDGKQLSGKQGNDTHLAALIDDFALNATSNRKVIPPHSVEPASQAFAAAAERMGYDPKIFVAVFHATMSRAPQPAAKKPANTTHGVKAPALVPKG